MLLQDRRNELVFIKRATCETEMTTEERQMSRPDSRWKAELRNLYSSAESNRSEATDENERHYQFGVMRACCSIWNRVTGEQLVNLDNL